jgi:hypothetical protein
MFSWRLGADNDTDQLNYTLHINSSSGSTDDDREYTVDGSLYCGAQFCNYTISRDLKYFGDDNYYYNWTVRGYDGQDFGSWSTKRNVTIYTNVSITLFNDTMNFGLIPLASQNDTTDNEPPPFRIRNNGNCYLDILINTTDFLWDSQAAASQFFVYKIGNVTGEEGSLNWSSQNTTTAWRPVPLQNTTCISYLNYSDILDEAEIEINITVPPDEGAGSKSSTIWFMAEYHQEV